MIFIKLRKGRINWKVIKPQSHGRRMFVYQKLLYLFLVYHISLYLFSQNNSEVVKTNSDLSLTITEEQLSFLNLNRHTMFGFDTFYLKK